MQFSLSEIKECLDLEVLFEKENIDQSTLFNISTDTRKLEKGDCYLPLRGENFDGHNFIDKAIQQGARGYFTQDKFKINKDADFVIYIKTSKNNPTNGVVFYFQIKFFFNISLNVFKDL